MREQSIDVVSMCIQSLIRRRSLPSTYNSTYSASLHYNPSLLTLIVRNQPFLIMACEELHHTAVDSNTPGTPEDSDLTTAIPDYLASPNAVFGDEGVQWRYGRPPDYTKTRKVWEESE